MQAEPSGTCQINAEPGKLRASFASATPVADQVSLLKLTIQNAVPGAIDLSNAIFRDDSGSRIAAADVRPTTLSYTTSAAAFAGTLRADTSAGQTQYLLDVDVSDMRAGTPEARTEFTCLLALYDSDGLMEGLSVQKIAASDTGVNELTLTASASKTPAYAKVFLLSDASAGLPLCGALQAGTQMNRSARTAETVSGVYLALMLSVTVSVRMNVSAGLLGTAAGLVLPLPLALDEKKRRAATIIIGGVLLAAFLAVFLLPGLPGVLGEAHALLHGRAEDDFGSGRIYIWKNVWQAAKERPLFGGGPDTLSRRITAYFERYDEAGHIVRRTGIDTAHNEYLNILANQGLFALLCWLGALGCSAVRFVRRAGERPAALICGSAVLGYCVQAFFGISMCLSTPFFVIAWAMLETREN